MSKRLLLLLAVVLIFPVFAFSDPVVINFDDFSDTDVLTNQISGLIFTNGMLLTAVSSLNEIDFPPHSGANVLVDNGGAIRIDFDFLVSSFSGFFTYTQSLLLQGFDAGNNPVASASSASGSNLGANELLSLAFAAGMR